MKELLKANKKSFCLFAANAILLLPLVVFGGQNFSIDSYGISLDQNIHIEAFIGSYRWFGALIYKLYYSLTGHNPISNSTVDIVIFIVMVSFMVTVFSLNIVKKIKREDFLTLVVANLSVLISVINVWFCNILSFPECVFITAVGVCLCFGAIIVFAESKGTAGCILSGILLICATGVYQQFISVFTIYVIAFCGAEILSRNNIKLKQIVLVYIKPAAIIVFSGLIYLGLGKLVQNICDIEANSRVALSIPTIMENIVYFATHQHSYLKGRGFFSSEILTFCFLVVGLLWFVLMVKDWLKSKNTIKVLFVFISYAAAYISAFLPGFLSTSHAARAMFALFSVFALFSIGILLMSENRYIKAFTFIILAVVFVMNMVVNVRCEFALKEQNAVDREWCVQVIDEIDRYEEEHTKKIKTIYYCFDKESELDLDSSESAVLQSYSLKSMINYYSERNFEIEELSDERNKELFADKDWDCFVIEEQLIFDDDVLYLCCY